jgi:hypothetical protein
MTVEQCRTCGRTWCSHYGDPCDLSRVESLPCKGTDWILKEGLCPKCGSEMQDHIEVDKNYTGIAHHRICKKCGHEEEVEP